MWVETFARLMSWHAATLAGVYCKDGMGYFVVLDARRNSILFLVLRL